MVLLQHFDSPGETNNLADTVRLHGELDRVALERAIERLVDRHESLRTRFVAETGEPRRVIDATAASPVEYVDLQLDAIAERDREPIARKQLAALAARPLDLARGPVFRATLARLAPDDQVLLIAMNIVADGWSLGVLRRDLWALYTALVRGEPSPLPALPLQYADYAAWERARWQDGAGSYWSKHLAGVPTLELPTDRPRPAVQSIPVGANCPFELSAELTANLKALGQQEGATLFIVLLTAFSVVLSRYSGQTDFAVGTLSANRTRVD